MKKQTYLITFLLVILGEIAFAQQAALYSQYQFNQSMINPAYTGINNVFNASVIARRQWVGIDGAPETNTLNVSSSLLTNKLAAGILVINDKYGANVNLEAQAQFNYKIDLLNGRSFSFGMQTGYFNYQYDYDKLLQEQADPALYMADANISTVNFGAGLFFKTNQYYIGLSVPQLINTQAKDETGNSTINRRHLYLSSGYVFDQLISIKIKPSILVKMVEGQPISIDLNASVLLLETFWIGASVRNLNTAGLNGQFEASDMLRLGYSFEVPLNGLSSNAFGTHELMVSIDLEIFNHQGRGRRYF